MVPRTGTGMGVGDQFYRGSNLKVPIETEDPAFAIEIQKGQLKGKGRATSHKDLVMNRIQAVQSKATKQFVLATTVVMVCGPHHV